MTAKTLLCVKLPATRVTYDFWIPSDMTINDATLLVAGLLERKASDFFHATQGHMLTDCQTGVLLDPNITVEEAKLINGSHLIFM